MRKSPLDTRPERRALRIYAFDPMLARAGDLRVTVEIPYRDLERTEHGFWDDRLQVIDYDAAARRYYRAIDLNDPRVAIQQGVEPSEADPQFHQQMVYAVASRTLESIDRALGRRLRFWGGQRLRLFPHLFQGRNAFYEPWLNAVVFGYFHADDDDPGANLPGQVVFTSLSYDIVAHEVAHAALDRLHRHYREPTNPQVPALHEAFADVVAIFQRFTFTDVVREVIRQTRGRLLDHPNPLVDVGAQFGAAVGIGAALRTVRDKPDPSRFATTREPHELGCILVAAIFDGFIRTYERRTDDLVRLATGGSGRLPDGELHPDLVNRLATECTRTAQAVLSMCIRATDYLPPVDPTFSDFLRAMVTADFELYRADEIGLRAAMIEAFRIRGIRPDSVGSLAVESLMLEKINAGPFAELASLVVDVTSLGAREMSRSSVAPRPKEGVRRPLGPLTSPSDLIREQTEELGVADEHAEFGEIDEPDDAWRDLGKRLWRWARANTARLGLEDRGLGVAGFHPVHRVAPGGELLVEMVAQFVQTRTIDGDLGGLKYRAGVTMVASIDGRIRYLIRKPFQPEREQALRGWVSEFDAEDGPAWPSGTRKPMRITEAFSTRAMDARRWR